MDVFLLVQLRYPWWGRRMWTCNVRIKPFGNGLQNMATCLAFTWASAFVWRWAIWIPFEHCSRTSDSTTEPAPASFNTFLETCETVLSWAMEKYGRTIAAFPCKRFVILVRRPTVRALS
ncbi:hypothetical protein RvY_18767-2 [Ramazzottius varieornatus]|uniref:Uncharacterized protein n=1 Tax=Ramazzottius varieornatus TaxID=947166 RepID=A0A1D1W702_RAMVA|nr:hypothetical protein RvY_18767-2 [Ramazzottius varieornatus]